MRGRNFRLPKVSNRQRQREAKDAIRAGTEARLILLAVLGQLGGTIDVSHDTITVMGRALDDLSYDIVPHPYQIGVWQLRLLDGNGPVCAPPTTNTTDAKDPDADHPDQP